MSEALSLELEALRSTWLLRPTEQSPEMRASPFLPIHSVPTLFPALDIFSDAPALSNGPPLNASYKALRTVPASMIIFIITGTAV